MLYSIDNIKFKKIYKGKHRSLIFNFTIFLLLNKFRASITKGNFNPIGAKY